jgi:PAS domain S-box-containing protein
MFVIITSTLQCGKKHGILVASISSIVVLVMDLFLFQKQNINIHFENDLILCGIFILIAWPLGHYVEIEEERIKYKTVQVNKLNYKLKSQNEKNREIERQLLKNEFCSRLIFENSKDVILIHDLKKVKFANKNAEELLGFNFEEFGSMSIFDILSNNLGFINKNFEDELKGIKNNIKFEAKLNNKFGKKIVAEVISNYFLFEGNPSILSIIHDISSEKQVEKLKKDVEKNVELLQETQEFADSIIESFANISHELKTPLNVIFSTVQLLDLHKKNVSKIEDKFEDYLTLIKQNCYRLMRLINNFLDITKIDSGFLKLNVVKCDIVKVVEDITLSVAPYLEGNNLNLIFDTNTEEKIMCLDPDKIERIMLNLLSNSVKYSKGSGEVFVNLTDNDDSITISVKDTGLGIPKEKHKLIFEKLGQVDKTLKRISEGSGIGLTLVKSFVEMHNGSIILKSEQGKGSEFEITIPTTLSAQNIDEDIKIFTTNEEKISIEFSDIYIKN